MPDKPSVNWMKRLARHYDEMRARYPDDELLILFDIDGTILDMRFMVLHVLGAYDEKHGTRFFQDLTLEQIEVHENQIDHLLEQLNLPPPQHEGVKGWYLENMWSESAIRESHRPFRSVMEVIRWFQIQPKTSVGLNTGRPETIRQETLRSLNRLGREYRVRFADDLLYMNPGGWDEDVPQSKAAGVQHLQGAGYRVIAAVDNEPENLTRIAEADGAGEILLLHADTIFQSARSRLPAGTAGGARYDITQLITERALPRHVQFVWHGLNDEANIRQFLASNIGWAECDVRMDGAGTLILRHDSTAETPIAEDEELLPLETILTRLDELDKAIKLDLKEGGEVIEGVTELLSQRRHAADRLWFNGSVDVLGEGGFRKLARAFPGSIIQCPIDFLVPLVKALPERGKEILDMLRSWGINRFSVKWDLPRITGFLDQMDAWGLEVNIYNIPDLESFLRAVLLQPRSITSDFNFPQWGYYGRGSGEKARRHEYELRSR